MARFGSASPTSPVASMPSCASAASDFSRRARASWRASSMSAGELDAGLDKRRCDHLDRRSPPSGPPLDLLEQSATPDGLVRHDQNAVSVGSAAPSPGIDRPRCHLQGRGHPPDSSGTKQLARRRVAGQAPSADATSPGLRRIVSVKGIASRWPCRDAAAAAASRTCSSSIGPLSRLP